VQHRRRREIIGQSPARAGLQPLKTQSQGPEASVTSLDYGEHLRDESALMLAAFPVIEQRSAAPLLPLRLFRLKTPRRLTCLALASPAPPLS
jgi:hypothetical protein